MIKTRRFCVSIGHFISNAKVYQVRKTSKPNTQLARFRHNPCKSIFLPTSLGHNIIIYLHLEIHNI